MKTVSLKCSNCGSSLDIKPNVTNLACGYCGTSLIVEREGGAIHLSEIGERITSVREGTDRTAAELAIRRLNQEIDRVNQQYMLLQADDDGGVDFVALAFPLLFIFVCVMVLFNLESLAWWMLLGIPSLAAAILRSIWNARCLRRERELAPHFRALEDEHDRLQMQLEAKLKIVSDE